MEEVKNFKKKQWSDTKNSFKRDPEKVRYGLKDFYYYYQRNLDREERNSVYNQRQKVYSAVLRLFIGKIMEKMIYEGFSFKLPCHMGNWLIVKKKIQIKVDEDGEVRVTGAKVNKVKTTYFQHIDKDFKKKKRQIYYLNEHTNGYRFLFRWNIMCCNAKNKTGYGIYPDKIHRKALHKAALDPDFKVNFVDVTRIPKVKEILCSHKWRKSLEEENNLN